MVQAGKGLAAVSARVCLKLWVNPLRLKESMVSSSGFTSPWLAVHTATRAGLEGVTVTCAAHVTDAP